MTRIEAELEMCDFDKKRIKIITHQEMPFELKFIIHHEMPKKYKIHITIHHELPKTRNTNALIVKNHFSNIRLDV